MVDAVSNPNSVANRMATSRENLASSTETFLALLRIRSRRWIPTPSPSRSCR